MEVKKKKWESNWKHEKGEGDIEESKTMCK